jgi:hypothetical protein
MCVDVEMDAVTYAASVAPVKFAILHVTFGLQTADTQGHLLRQIFLLGPCRVNQEGIGVVRYITLSQPSLAPVLVLKSRVRTHT